MYYTLFLNVLLIKGSKVKQNKKKVKEQTVRPALVVG